MRKRFTTLIGSFAFLLSTLFATIGLASTAHAALPGQVGDAPRCTVDAVGARDSAFKVVGNDATVTFKVSGESDCKVRVSTNSFYAPTMSGQPFSEQILFQRITKVYDKAGTYSITASLPAKSTKQKGCFYQVDLTYGTHNVQPVLAYGHSKLDCSPPPQPTFACVSLKAEEISRTTRKFAAVATASGGATIEKYEFGFGDGMGVTVPSNTFTYDYKKTGTFTASVVVHVNVGGVIKKVTAPACTAPVTITPAQEPVFACTSLMATLISKENRSYAFNLKYQAEGGAVLRDVDFDFGDGQTMKAVSPAALSTVNHSYTSDGQKTATATLHFTVPGSTTVNDKKCEVTFNVSPEACAINPSLPKDSPDCKPAVLPASISSTGPTDMILGGMGLSSLTAAGYYWRSSRNRLIAKLLGQ